MTDARVKDIPDDQIVEIVRDNIAPSVGVAARFDILGCPKQLHVEFCGWSVDVLLAQEESAQLIGKLPLMIRQAFADSRAKPNIFRRFFRRVRLLFKRKSIYEDSDE